MTRPVVVLGSSLGTDRCMWGPVGSLLAPHFDLLAYDMRGHGGAQAPPGPYELADLAEDVLALMDQRKVQRAHWVGVSIGGMIGMWIAARVPERIDRLVVCSSAARVPSPEAYRRRAVTVRDAGSMEPIADAVIERWLTPEFAASHADVRARLRRMLTSCDPDGYAECCGAVERMDLRKDLLRIAAPTLVISAPGDVATPPRQQEEIAEGIAGARLAMLEDGAHVAPVERAEEVAALILEHLST